MLENNFNVLDNDFVTLWSKYLTTGNLNLETLAMLAELGQVNAIQAYYLKECDEPLFPNYTIGDKCEALPKDYSGRLAKINMEYGSRFPARPDANDVFLDKFYGEIVKVLTLAKIEYEENNNVMAGEDYLEMLYEEIYNPENADPRRNIDILAKEVREKLQEKYFSLAEPQYAFALGKNMMYFAENKDMFKDGIAMLQDLAKRNYSKKFTKYQEEVKFAQENAITK